MSTESLGISLGSNLGNRIENFRCAVENVLSLCKDKNSLLTSAVYETTPVDCPEGSEPFYNAVIEVNCSLAPLEILDRCQMIERKLGRRAARKINAPRPIDLDLLYFGDLTLSETKLILPHPQLTKRRFMLEPLSEIRPGLILPGETSSVEEILAKFDSDEPPLKRIYESGFWL